MHTEPWNWSLNEKHKEDKKCTHFNSTAVWLFYQAWEHMVLGEQVFIPNEDEFMSTWLYTNYINYTTGSPVDTTNPNICKYHTYNIINTTAENMVTSLHVSHQQGSYSELVHFLLQLPHHLTVLLMIHLLLTSLGHQISFELQVRTDSQVVH